MGTIETQNKRGRKMKYFPAYKIDGKENVFTDRCETVEQAQKLAKVIKRAHPAAVIGYGYFNDSGAIVCVFPDDETKRGKQ